MYLTYRKINEGISYHQVQDIVQWMFYLTVDEHELAGNLITYYEQENKLF